MCSQDSRNDDISQLNSKEHLAIHELLPNTLSTHMNALVKQPACSPPHLFEDGHDHCLPGVVCQWEAAVPAGHTRRLHKKAVLSRKTNTRLQDTAGAPGHILSS